MKPSAVLFDCDGVLVDSEPITDRVLAANLARHGLALPEHEIGAMFLGGTIAGLGEEARRMGATLPATWVDDVYAEIFAVLARGTPLVPGIPALLDRLDAARIPYAVGSNGPHAKMDVTLGQHPEIRARLAGRIFSRHDVARPKPAPDLYLHAASALGAAPETCAVVEDSPTGARAALAAGMTCFGYAPGGDGARLASVGARPFRHMDELPALLGL